HGVRVGAAEGAEVHHAAGGHEALAETAGILGVAGAPVAVFELLDRHAGAGFHLVVHEGHVSVGSMSRTLVELSDRWDLQDLMTRYATCIDSRDFDGLDRVFTPDACVSYAASGGPEDDYPAVRAWLAEMLPIFAATQHLMGNLEVSLDGDSATGRCMCFDRM